jgi:hypothetical protein
MTDNMQGAVLVSITERWRRVYNWIPPSEDPAYIKKWADFKATSTRDVTVVDQSIAIPQFIALKTWDQQ